MRPIFSSTWTSRPSVVSAQQPSVQLSQSCCSNTSSKIARSTILNSGWQTRTYRGILSCVSLSSTPCVPVTYRLTLSVYRFVHDLDGRSLSSYKHWGICFFEQLTVVPHPKCLKREEDHSSYVRSSFRVSSPRLHSSRSSTSASRIRMEFRSKLTQITFNVANKLGITAVMQALLGNRLSVRRPSSTP